MERNLKKGDRVALVCCSDGLPERDRGQIIALKETLKLAGLIAVESPYIYQRDSIFSGTGRERAEALMNCYLDDSVKAVFDISGGDIGNEILDKLDFEVIGRNEKLFFGYSDLTVILNAIYAKTERPSGLYQIRNLVGRSGDRQTAAFINTFITPGEASAEEKSIWGRQDMQFCPGGPALKDDSKDLCHFQYHLLRGEGMEGTVIGGNIRCFLKLAGTEFLPHFENKILFIESNGGETAKIMSMVSQLKQMGVFDKIAGVLLGTFTDMEKNGCIPTAETMIMEASGRRLPVAKTSEIGHGSDSKCLMIGRKLVL